MYYIVLINMKYWKVLYIPISIPWYSQCNVSVRKLGRREKETRKRKSFENWYYFSLSVRQGGNWNETTLANILQDGKKEPREKESSFFSGFLKLLL